MDRKTVLDQTAQYVEKTLRGDSSGHDWWHIYRVWKTAIVIGEREGANLFVVQLAALLHDIADWKFHGGDETLGSKVAHDWLTGLGVETDVVSHVSEIIGTLSFKGANEISGMRTKEGMVVQDADRLDAIGAIGIARAFAYGGYADRPIYEPDINPKIHQNAEDYKRSSGTTINHFFEKLFLLKDLMNTDTARVMAEKRHQFMELFVARFLAEWQGRE